MASNFEYDNDDDFQDYLAKNEYRKNNLLEIIQIIQELEVGSPEYQDTLREISNHEMLNLTHIKSNPRIEWDVDLLAQNRQITPEWVHTLPQKPWDFQKITKRIFENSHKSDLYELHQDYLNTYCNFNYDSFVTLSDNIKILWLKLFPDANWDYDFIFQDPLLSLGILKQIHPEKINYSLVSRCAHLDVTWIEAFPEGNWNYQEISAFSIITLDWIKKYPDKPWDFVNLSLNHHINFDILSAFPDRDWCFNQDTLARKKLKYFTLEDAKERLNYFYRFIFNMNWFEKFPTIDWDFKIVSFNRNLKLKYVIKYPDLEWDFANMSDNNNLTASHLRHFKNEKWNFKILAQNNSFEIDWFYVFPDAPWDFKLINRSNNFKADWVVQLPDKAWDLKILNNIYDPDKRLLTVCHYLHYHPEVDMIEQLNDTRNEFYSSASDTDEEQDEDEYLIQYLKKPKFNEPVYLLRPDYAKHKCFKKLLSPEVLDYPKLTVAEKLNYLVYLQRGIKIKKLIPDMFKYPDFDLELTDLSGEQFYLSNWFNSDNIMADIHNAFPQLGNIDIYIEDEIYDAEIFGSKNTNQQLIEKLCHTRNGPCAMIVYPDIESESSSDCDSKDREEISIFD